VRCGIFLDGTGGRVRDAGLLVAGDRIVAAGPWSEIAGQRFSSTVD